MLTVAQAFALALQHHQAGRLAEAEALYRQILALQPAHAEALHHYGVILYQFGRHEVAIESLRRAIALKPDSAGAYSNLGVILAEQGRTNEAIDAYRRAITLRPDLPETHNNLANALREAGQLDESLAAARKALELKPDLAEAHDNLGNTLRDYVRLDEAIDAYHRALHLKPTFAKAHSNLGNALRERGESGAAILAFRRSIELEPNRAFMHSNLIFSLHFDPASSPGMIREEQRRWNRRFCEPFMPFILPYANDGQANRPLKVGYVSSDFCDQVTGRNIFPLVKNHDHRNLEMIYYSGVLRPDGLTAELLRAGGLWRSILGQDDQALAETIRQDGVDILVDLTLHSARNHLPLFARKPAPVQVSFAGYPESTGVEAIEYRISDGYLECGMSGPGTPVEIEWKANSELPHEQVYLIDSFWCYDPCGMEVAVNALPAAENGFITFGSLNHFGKVNDPLLKLWARVLRQVPESRLVMLSGFGSHRRRTIEFLEREGIAVARVEFAEPRPRQEYLELYHRLDVVLDTFPYNGHTTSLDALWMGVPVVSLAGDRPVSRGGLSQLSNLGLPELVAHLEDEYVEIATRLANDIPRLAELRRTLRTRMESSVLMDAPRFARQIEQAYRAMWRQWCAQASS